MESRHITMTKAPTAYEAALLRLVTDPGDEPRAAPKLNGRTFEKLLGSFDSFAVGKELQRIVG
jgi:hypothetical protein